MVDMSKKFGSASGLAMANAAWVKGSTALLASVHALAESLDVRRHLEQEWRRSQPGLSLFSRRKIPVAARKAWSFEVRSERSVVRPSSRRWSSASVLAAGLRACVRGVRTRSRSLVDLPGQRQHVSLSSHWSLSACFCGREGGDEASRRDVRQARTAPGVSLRGSCHFQGSSACLAVRWSYYLLFSFTNIRHMQSNPIPPAIRRTD